MAYTVTETDWKKDRYLSQIWIAEVGTRRRFQLTQGEKGAGGQQWSPDGRWLAFLSGREGDSEEEKPAERQIWLISPSGEEAVQLTTCETDVQGFKWSRDGRQIAFLAAAPESKAMGERKETYGDFEVVDEDLRMSELWVVTVRSKRAKRMFSEGERSVTGCDWSPDGKKLAVALVTDPRPRGWETSHVYVLDLEKGSVRSLVTLRGPNSNPIWSPDGTRIAFNTAMGREDFYFGNTRIAVIRVGGRKPVCLTEGFDESAYLTAWGPEGIYFEAAQKTAAHLFRVDPDGGECVRLSEPDEGMGFGFNFTANFGSPGE